MGHHETTPTKIVPPGDPPAIAADGLPGIGGNDVMEILAGVEQQFDRLRQAQAARSEEVKALADRAHELDERQGEIDAQLEDLARREAELVEGRATLDGDRASLSSARAEMERVLAEQRTALESAAREIDESRADLEQREAALQEQRATLERRTEEVESTSAEAARRAEEADQVRSEALGRLEQVESESRVLREQLDEAERRMVAVREQAETAEQAAMEMLLETEQQRDAARAELEQAGQQRDAVSAELAETGAQRDAVRAELAESEQRAEALQGELDDSRQKLEVAGEKLAGFLQILNSQGGQLEETVASAELVAQQQREIADLRRQLEAAGTSTESDEERDALRRRIDELTSELESSRTPPADVARLARLEDENGQLLAQLECVRDKLKQSRAAGGGGEATAAMAEERDALRDEVAELKAKCIAAEGEVERIREEMQRKAAELQVKTNRLAEEAKRQEQRGARLTKLSNEIEQLRREAADRPDPEAQREASEQIRRQRRELERVQKMLASSERRMIKKWAKSRAALAVFATVLVLAITAVGSWMATSRVFPPKTTASVTLAAEGLRTAGYPQETVTTWHTWHTALLYEDSFHEAVAGRMGERLIEPYRTAEAVSALMADEIAVDSERSGMITISLSQPDPETARTILEIVAGAVESESLRRQATRGDEISVVQVASAEGADPVRIMTVEDHRVQRAMPIFGGSLVVVLALFAFAYVRFNSAKRVLESDADLFEDDAPAAPLEIGALQSLKDVPL